MITRADLTDWMDRVVRDPVIREAAKGVDRSVGFHGATCALGVDLRAEPRLLDHSAAASADILLAASPEAWTDVMRPDPPPGSHSFGAILRLNDQIAVTGSDIAIAQALACLERIIELARPAPGPLPPPAVERRDESVIGRRRWLDAGGHRALIHWLEAGDPDATPILFLHTAGADARQFRHQLADPELQAQYRMVAFDLPRHGGSGGFDDHDAPVAHRLTEAEYLAWCTAVLEREIRRPAIIVGCSMGASMALTVTAKRPDLILGCIALEAPLRAPGRRSPMLSHGRVATPWHNPSYVRALLSPTAPQPRRDEACMIYAQARPGIYDGDLAYYSDEYDGARLADALRANGRPIQLLTGSYDYSSSPENTRQLHQAIKAPHCRFTEMTGLGHFPMIEDPDLFRGPFLTALAAIREARS